MSNYNQNVVSGTETKWQRCCRIEIQNSFAQAPIANFFEEILTTLPDGTTMKSPTGGLQMVASDLTQSFSLIDPSSGGVVGTMTYAQLYGAIYSLYLTLAAARDVTAGGSS